MKINEFFEHHGLLDNPFYEEDAQTDLVFKGHCVKTTFHSAWDKLYGNPAEPSTSVVFGEKGAGKTALRLQMIRMLNEYNTNHPDKQPLVVDYADLNPFIDRFRNRVSRGRKIQKVLVKWEIWDHLDAILSLGVTQLIDRILDPGVVSHPAAIDSKPLPVEKLNAHQVRDLLLLAACYDTSRSENVVNRWKRLARKLRYETFLSRFINKKEMLISILGMPVVAYLFHRWNLILEHFGCFVLCIFLCGIPAYWMSWPRWFKAWSLRRSLRTLPHLTGELAKVLLRLRKQDFRGMPFPVGGSTDNRYAMLEKFLGISETLGFNGLIVLVDRVDEPYLINGSTELMKLVVWPIFDNKLLKHEKVGLKLLLPVQLLHLMEREDSTFHQRARLDKQHLVRSLDWTGESLFDLINARLKACAADGKNPVITDFFDPGIDKKRLLDVFALLKVPRHLFKFLYRVFTQHVQSFTSNEPNWKVTAATFESVLALYLRDRDAAEKNLGVL